MNIYMAVDLEYYELPYAVADTAEELAYLDSIEEDGTDDLWIIPLEDAECALWNVAAWKPRPEPWKGEDDDERGIEQMQHDMLYEPTYNSEDGSM